MPKDESLQAFLLSGFARAMAVDEVPPTICQYVSRAHGYVGFRLCVVASSEEQARRCAIGWWRSIGGWVEHMQLVDLAYDHRGTLWSFPDGWVRSDLMATNEEDEQ